MCDCSDDIRLLVSGAGSLVLVNMGCDDHTETNVALVFEMGHPTAAQNVQVSWCLDGLCELFHFALFCVRVSCWASQKLDVFALRVGLDFSL